MSLGKHLPDGLDSAPFRRVLSIIGSKHPNFAYGCMHAMPEILPPQPLHGGPDTTHGHIIRPSLILSLRKVVVDTMYLCDSTSSVNGQLSLQACPARH
jgi:hypothetical protein